MKALLRALACAAAVATTAVLLLVAVVVIEDGDASATGATAPGVLRHVPAEFEPWILKADSACSEPAMSPALLAAQLHQESGFATSATSEAGAQGPAQFVPGTWAVWGRDADGNGRSSPREVGDAVMAQGRFMCSLLGEAGRSGYGGDPRALALAGYNAGWGTVRRFRGVPPIWFARRAGQKEGETYHYVKTVLAALPRFEASARLQVSGSGAGPDALRRAAAYLGTPYSWGGGTPDGPSTGFCDGTNGYLRGTCSARATVGFDCSSLVQYAYWRTTRLPRVAAAQYGATSDHPVSRRNLKPGDLLFWSTAGSAAIYHVALYAGDGNVLHAPRTGRNVELAPLTSAMPSDEYYGATRP